MSDSILVPLSYMVAVAGPILSALVGAIVYLAKMKDKAEEGRLNDLRASGSETRSVLERVLPLLERVTTEMRLRNSRLRPHSEISDSEPPASGNALEDTLTRVKRLEDLAREERDRALSLMSKGGTKDGDKAP